jgi:SAM-dependent methyltransferase
MLLRKVQKDTRSIEQIKEHYEIEKELADKLRKANNQERLNLYTSVYDELLQRVPHHPQLTAKKDPKLRLIEISKQLRLLNQFLNKDSIFMEIGPGDCLLSFEVAKHVKKVYAIDVSKELTYHKSIPGNFELIISDGSNVPVPADTVNLAYSDQLMEHLHPDDAFNEMLGIYKALATGGHYICSTPNRLSGPHDISYSFDEYSTGFHLKEYTVTELSNLFLQVGFSKIELYTRLKGYYFKIPLFAVKILEYILDKLPFTLKTSLASSTLVSLLLGITISGKK